MAAEETRGKGQEGDCLGHSEDREGQRQLDGVLVGGGRPRNHQRSLDLIPEEVRL